MFLFKTILIGLIFIVTNFNIYSLPRFSVRLGDKCIDCHYNPTGGIIRNDNGFFYGQNVLSLISPRSKDLTLSPKINDNISIGLDLRGQFLYSQEKKKADFQRMTGSVYGRIGLSQNINILARYDFIQDIWEAYGIAHILPNNGYIKAGTFQPNFGIRLDDHTAYTRGGDFFLLFTNGARAGSIYNPFYVETGVEVGLYFSEFVFLTTSVGTNHNNGTFSNDPSYTARLEITPSIEKAGLMFGGSFVSAKIPHPASVYAGFAGFGFDRFTLLAEYDIGKDLTGPETYSNILMVEAGFLLMAGLEAYARFDRLDPNRDADNDEIAHLILGFEFIPYSFIEIRPQYRFILEEPSTNNDSVVIQFHFWY
ncbi:MAG: hypothetical protein PVF17_13735 [Ignavibacteria bacterium]|jgi:hypothetical protein